MTIKAVYPVIPTNSVTDSRDFYVQLFDMDISFENEWYVSLVTKSEPRMQIGFVEAAHESIPAGHKQRATGCIVTVEVDDVDAVRERARISDHRCPLELRDEAWGQRHFMVLDPNEILVDVVKVIPPSPEFAASYTTPIA